jgi:hypothetical protein
VPSRRLNWVEFVLCVGYNLVERSVLGLYIGELIRNSTVANVTHKQINFGETGEQIVLIVKYILRFWKGVFLNL